jgi:carbonic anhydrase
MGSKTTPPCEESVVWFVLEEPRQVGPTVLAMFREALSIPGQTAVNFDNIDGNNR